MYFKKFYLIFTVVLAISSVAFSRKWRTHKNQPTGVQVTFDVSHAPDLYDFASLVKMAQEYWFDYMAYLLSSPGFVPTEHIHIFFDPVYDGVAYVDSCHNITGGVRYYRNNQHDIGSMVHEMLHNLQCYGSPIHWYLTEGIADYYRFFHYEPQNKPSKPGSHQSYKDGYRTTAYFLNYVNTLVRNDTVYYLNKDAREGNYNDDFWPKLTGKTIDELWEDMLIYG